MNDILIGLDIGNTTARLGIFRRRRLEAVLTIPTLEAKTPGALARRWRALPSRSRAALTSASDVLICSVVPRATRAFAESLHRLTDAQVVVVGRQVKVPVINRYARPSQVGQDRLVGAYAAWLAYRRDCIVADFGTAITIDVITRTRRYLGGVIAPGLEMSVHSLAKKTALLPVISLRAPSGVLGRTTPESIRAGLLYGYGALCDGLVAQLKARYAPGATVVATGGECALMAKYAKSLTHIRPHLVLEGLCALGSSRPLRG